MRHLLYAAMAAYGRGEYDAAARALQPLADVNVPDAQANLGLLYEAGRGVEQDLVKAHMWLSLAADQGMPQAQKRLKKLVGKMTAEQIAEAEELRLQWQPRRE